MNTILLNLPEVSKIIHLSDLRKAHSKRISDLLAELSRISDNTMEILNAMSSKIVPEGKRVDLSLGLILTYQGIRVRTSHTRTEPIHYLLTAGGWVGFGGCSLLRINREQILSGLENSQIELKSSKKEKLDRLLEFCQQLTDIIGIPTDNHVLGNLKIEPMKLTQNVNGLYQRNRVLVVSGVAQLVGPCGDSDVKITVRLKSLSDNSETTINTYLLQDPFTSLCLLTTEDLDRLLDWYQESIAKIIHHTLRLINQLRELNNKYGYILLNQLI